MNKLFYYFILSTKKRKTLKFFSMDLDGSARLVGKPLSVGRDFGEDAGFAGAGAGSERSNADDVVRAGTVGADEGSAGVAHAGRPALAGFAKADDVIGKAPVLSQKLAGTPDSAGDLLETISEGLRVTLDQAPSREHAVLGSTVVLASGSQAGGSSVGAGEVDGLSELHKGDVVVELFGAVVALVDVDLGDGKVLLGAIASLQVPFTDTDGVGGGVLGLTEAVGSAEDVLVSNEGTTADVSVTTEAKGDLPGELAMAGVDAVDDTAAATFLSALLVGTH